MNKELETIDSRILTNLRKIIRAVDIFSSRLRQIYDLNTSRLACLKVLYRKGDIPLNEISRETFLSPSTITSAVDRLEEKKLVERKRISDDRRVIIIGLTLDGKIIAKSTPDTLHDKLAGVVSKLEKKDKEVLDKILYSMTEALENDKPEVKE
ncbi:MAG: MarR family transcriptional regulator [Candidatus Firestonebacteria bacterium]